MYFYKASEFAIQNYTMNYLKTLLIALIALCTSTTIAQNDSNKKTLLAIVAHADDETFFSPLLSAYSERYNVHLVIVTNGDMGVRDHAKIPAGKQLQDLRVKEATAACKVLGINKPIFMNYGDGDLHKWEPLFQLDDDIQKLFTTYKPDAILTWGPEGGYGHPDHRIVSNIVTEVFQKAPPTSTSELYYYAITQTVLDKTGNFKTQMGDYFKNNMHALRTDFITHQIAFSNTDLKKGREAFACHWSQFTSDEMDDIYQILDQSEGIIYLRQWNGKVGKNAKAILD